MVLPAVAITLSPHTLTPLPHLTCSISLNHSFIPVSLGIHCAPEASEEYETSAARKFQKILAEVSKIISSERGRRGRWEEGVPNAF